MNNLTPWKNKVSGWTPTTELIITLMRWYPIAHVRSNFTSEGACIGHLHYTTDLSSETVTALDAVELLVTDLNEIHIKLNKLLNCEISEGQYLALMSFSFECHTSKLQTLGIVDALNAHNPEHALALMMQENKTRGHFDLFRHNVRAVEAGWFLQP